MSSHGTLQNNFLCRRRSAVPGRTCFWDFSAAPVAHAQDLGDLINKAKDTIGKAKDAADGAKGKSGESNKSDPDNGAGKSDAAPSGGGRAENIVFAQNRVADALRKVAPGGAALLIVSCKANSNKTYSYTTACLFASPTGKKSAIRVPVPASVNAAFAAFHDNYQKNGYGQEAWDVCRVTLPLGQRETFGDENAGQFDYGFNSRRGQQGNDRAYAMVTPAQLLAKFQKVHVEAAHERQVRAANEAKHPLVQDASMKTWVCGYCGETRQSVYAPGSHDGGDCPKNAAGGGHDWELQR